MKRIPRWIPLLLTALALASLPPAKALAHSLGVEVWTDRGDDAVYQPGDAMLVKVRASDDAYLIVYEIDSNGHINVLYPWRRGTNMVEGHRTYRLPPDDSGYELAVEKATGEGYIVAIASRHPFRDLPWYLRSFDPQAEGNGYEDRHDEEEGFDKDGNVVGDPMVAMERIRRRVLDRPSDTDEFSSAYASYYVGHEVRYPRYLCADCHRAGQWAWWDGFDPYYTQCSVFDFRVNWNWCWGPCIWTGYVPYYYYCPRSDCPPRYYAWYSNHSRWSAWDGRRAWVSLWGGNLTRYKGPPPAGYVPPPSTKPAWDPGGARPPGYLPASNDNSRRGGFRAPMPISRVPVDNGTRDPGAVREPRQLPGGAGRDAEPPRALPGSAGGDRSARPTPVVRRPREDSPRETPRRETPRRETPRQEQPRRQPEQRKEPRHDRQDNGERGERRGRNG
jgi:hypothetical protein